MNNPGPQRQQITELLASVSRNDAGGGLLMLLQPLRVQLASLVSEEGFNFLLERTIFQTVQSFPWLNAGPTSTGEARIDELRALLALRTHEDALAASTFLLLHLVGLVASLIGEPLTDGILGAAWGDDALGTWGEDNQA